MQIKVKLQINIDVTCGVCVLALSVSLALSVRTQCERRVAGATGVRREKLQAFIDHGKTDTKMISFGPPCRR
jgi:hypothetical protein